MTNPEGKKGTVRETTASKIRIVLFLFVDVIVRVVAAISGLVSLAAYHRFSLRIGFSVDLLILSYTTLMVLCVARPLHPSQKWLTIFSIVTLLAIFDFIVNRTPSLTTSETGNYDTVYFYVADLIIVVWSGGMAWITRSTRKL